MHTHSHNNISQKTIDKTRLALRFIYLITFTGSKLYKTNNITFINNWCKEGLLETIPVTNKGNLKSWKKYKDPFSKDDLFSLSR